VLFFPEELLLLLLIFLLLAAEAGLFLALLEALAAVAPGLVPAAPALSLPGLAALFSVVLLWLLPTAPRPTLVSAEARVSLEVPGVDPVPGVGEALFGVVEVPDEVQELVELLAWLLAVESFSSFFMAVVGGGEVVKNNSLSR
jgi:hypothetical protein